MAKKVIEKWYVRLSRTGVILGPVETRTYAENLAGEGDLVFSDSIFREKLGEKKHG